MTPKEKAKELLINFRYYDANGVNLAKQLSIRCVEELLYFADTQANGSQKGEGVRVDWVEYFNEVINELKNV